MNQSYRVQSINTNCESFQRSRL